ncbi:conjugal transfer protein TraP, partial [Salmonella enterica]|uniref:conjugal transfer protein TraP n=1 Tax=Salmonella enterica TaxID=28901 RepID=UPI003C6E760A
MQMGNNRLNSLKGRAVLYRIAGLVRWLILGVKYAIIWPRAPPGRGGLVVLGSGEPGRC